MLLKKMNPVGMSNNKAQTQQMGLSLIFSDMGNTNQHMVFSIQYNHFLYNYCKSLFSLLCTSLNYGRCIHQCKNKSIIETDSISYLSLVCTVS